MQQMMDVMDRLKDGGVEKVGLVSQPGPADHDTDARTMAMTNDLVSSTIAARQREPEGLRKMMIASAPDTVVAIVAIVVIPWLVRRALGRSQSSMEVSLGGAPGPVTGGMTPLVGRAVQKAEPKPDLPKPSRRVLRPRRTPEMVEPIDQAHAASRPSQAAGGIAVHGQAPPTTGETVRPGQARAETGSTSNEAGLSTGGRRRECAGHDVELLRSAVPRARWSR